jgi:hypothetical protein
MTTITLTEKISLSDKEIRVLRQVGKRGRSFLPNTGDELIGRLNVLELIETFYHIAGVDSGIYWRVTKKGKAVLKQL